MAYTSTLMYIIGFLAILSSIFYAVTALSLLRLYLSLGGEMWARLTLGFTLLSLSQASMAFSIASQDASLSYALYTTTPALAISGIYMIWSSRRLTQIPALSPLVLAPMTLDLVAFTLIILTLSGFKGHVRVGFTLIALAHLGRALGSLLLPGFIPALILVVSEALRAMGALYMALWYARRII